MKKYKERDRDRVREIYKHVAIEKLPFKLKNPENLNDLGLDIAMDLRHILKAISLSPSLKWCMSTVKKAKVFILIYQANETGKSIYKEEISKLLPEYSYKTIATIVDEGVEKGYYVPLDPFDKEVSDKKIKNIRPSFDVITDFYNWNIERIALGAKLIEKYK